MSKSACKCKKAHECEECPEWIFTFADLVMLMMGFFVILWVLKPPAGKKSTGDGEQYLIKIEASIREAFGYEPNPHSKDPVDMQMIINRISRTKLNGPGIGGKTSMEPEGAQGSQREVTDIRPAKQATEGGKLLFARGSAVLTEQTTRELEEIAQVVRGHRNIILVKGHTSLDDLPDDATPQQRMDLSLRRGQAAVDYLTSHGVDPQILRVQGCSTFEPLIQHEYTLDAQALNRRVEVEATAMLADDLQGAKPSPDNGETPGTTAPSNR